MDAMVEAIIVIDERGTIERFNSTAERMFGYRPEEILGQNIKVLMPPADSNRHDKYINNFTTNSKCETITILLVL